MRQRFLIRFFLSHLCWLALALVVGLLPGLASAQSACTALYATRQVPALAISYYNFSAGTASKWTTIATPPAAVTNANALAGDRNSGLLWFIDRPTATLFSFSPNTYVFSAGVVLGTAPPAGAAGNILGATFDNNPSPTLYLLATTGANGFYYLSSIPNANLAAGTNSPWTTVTYTAGGGTPSVGGSGDIATDNAGISYLVTNAGASAAALYPLTLATAQVGASVTIPGIGASSIAGLAFDPVTNTLYAGGGTSGTTSFTITTATGAITVVDTSANTVSDLANCSVPPAKPSVTKSFSPTYNSLGGTTSTLTIALGNSNTAPIWLIADFVDVLPTGVTIAAAPSLTTGACVASATVTNVITATAGQSTVTFTNGGRIPAGGCTITVSVTAAANATSYTNTIPAGSVTTTAGSSTLAATATYKVGTDFAVTKTEGTGTAGPYSTGPLTVPGGTTMQYILTVTNSSSGGTGSATFTDTLPSLITPVLSITAAMVGGGAGTCATATGVVGGSTQITGTMTNVIAGAVCSITVTTKVSATQTVATVVTNTLTLAPLAGTSDTNSANNAATVTTTVGASANITISKTNGTTTMLAGSTTSYTLTIANLGPADASGSLVKDPSAAGLNCTTVSCTATTANICPAGPTIGTLQGAGLALSPTFPSGSTASFVVTCGVTATGQ